MSTLKCLSYKRERFISENEDEDEEEFEAMIKEEGDRTIKRNNKSQPFFSDEDEDDIIDINKNVLPSIPFLDYSNENFNNYQYNKSKNDKKDKKCNKITIPKPRSHCENFNYSYISPKFDSICLNDLPLERLVKIFPSRKINVVLDIDQTLIYSKDLPKFNEMNKHLITVDSHHIQVSVKNQNFDLVFNLRTFLKEFLLSLKKICTFFICTLSHENYAREIVSIIKTYTGIEIPEENIVALGASTNNVHFGKTLGLFRTLQNPKDTIIVDDSAAVWKDVDLDNLILSKKYYSFNDREYAPFQYIAEGKLRFDKDCFFEDDINHTPIHMENENTSKQQLKYLTEFIENSFKMSLMRNEEVSYAMQKLRKRILNNTKINFSYYVESKEINFLKEIVKYLGGETTMDKSNCTHFVFSKQNSTALFSKPNLNHCKIICVNVKWIFHSYFFLKRMDENDEEYKVEI